MVHLIGIHHAGYESLFGEIRLRDFSVQPSPELIKFLLGLPEGTKVGLETLSNEDWNDIKQDLMDLTDKKWETLYGRDKSYGVSYSGIDQQYWDSLINACKEFGLGTVFLEEKNVWLKYNRASLNQAVLQAVIHNKVLFKREEESDEDYHKKLLRCNEARHKAEIKARKIHEIERDTKLLESIAQTGVDLAIVGQGHSDFWWAEREIIAERCGINFSEYSTDLGIVERRTLADRANYDTTFTRNATCDSRLIFDRESLERAIRLIEKGRITENGTPDYVGIWDIPEPFLGYFEVFVDKRQGDKFSGHIQDCLGVAGFNASLSDSRLELSKQYNPDLSLRQAGKGDIQFRAVRKSNEFYGRFYIGGYGAGPFYMVKAQQRNPDEMSIRFEELLKEDLESFKNISLNKPQEPKDTLPF